MTDFAYAGLSKLRARVMKHLHCSLCLGIQWKSVLVFQGFIACSLLTHSSEKIQSMCPFVVTIQGIGWVPKYYLKSIFCQVHKIQLFILECLILYSALKCDHLVTLMMNDDVSMVVVTKLDSLRFICYLVSRFWSSQWIRWLHGRRQYWMLLNCSWVLLNCSWVNK